MALPVFQTHIVSDPVPKLTGGEAARALKMISELATRKTDALRLYKPMPPQLEFHKSNAPERLLLGSNRSGKTMAACMECAWASRGEHPYLDYPKGDMEIYCIAKDERQIAEVWWKKLTRPGCGKQFYMIRDEETDEFRIYDQSKDLHRKLERRKVPPLIPRRYWAGDPVWTTKKGDCPKLLTLKNGTRIHFFTANGRPLQGVAIDLALFDEEVESLEYYEEVAARLVDYNGRFVWSATPQAGSEALWDLHQRAEEQEGEANPSVTQHFCHIDDNQYLSNEVKNTLKAKYTSPDTYQIRIEGKFVGQQKRIYPNFSMGIHGIDDFEIPKTWTRYMVVDPGTQCMCTLFFAIPEMERPQESPLPETWIEKSTGKVRPIYGDFVYLYKEIYMRPCLGADVFGDRIAKEMRDEQFWEFIIDSHAGRQTPMGSTQTVEYQYREALYKHGVKSHQTGHGFCYGTDNIKAGNLAVHDWLFVRGSDGQTKLRAFRSCLGFKTQIEKYHKKKVGEIYTDDPVKKNDDGPDCVRYIRSRNPSWHESPQRKRKQGGMFERFKKLRNRNKPPSEGCVNLGPSRHKALV